MDKLEFIVMKPNSNLTPRQVFEYTQELLLKHDIEGYLEFFAENAIIEFKFTSSEQARKLEGKEIIVKTLRASSAAAPIRRIGFRNTVIHETIDPEVIIVEYDMLVESTKDTHKYKISDVLVLRVKLGQIVNVRAYSNPILMAYATNSIEKLISELQQLKLAT